MINLAPIKDSGPDIINRLNDISKLKYLYFKLHESSGNDISEESGLQSTFTLSAAGTTHQWDNAGYFTGASGATAGDRYYRDGSQTEGLDDICRFDTIANGSILISCRINIATKANISAKNNLFSYGSTAGGFFLEIDASGNLDFNIRDTGSNLVPLVIRTAANWVDGTVAQVGCVVNLSSKLGQGYVDGAASGSQKNFSALTAAYHSNSVNTGTKGGITLFADSSLATPDDRFAEASTGIKVADLFFARVTDSSLHDNQTQIFADLFNNPGDIPKSLVDV